MAEPWNCADQMFLKENSQHVSEFNDQQLVTMQFKEKPSLDKWFSLHFSSESTITACLDEEFIVSTFYTNQDVVDLLGQEMCIAIDVALAGDGCEAVVKAFTALLVRTRSLVASQTSLLQNVQLSIGVYPTQSVVQQP